MARLNLETVARWAGADHTGFATSPILVAVSVSDDQGRGVATVPASAFHLRYVDDPDFGAVTASVTFFREMSGPSGVGEYELVIKPSEELPGQRFRQDELFVFVAARHAGNDGQAVTLARYHVFA